MEMVRRGRKCESGVLSAAHGVLFWRRLSKCLLEVRSIKVGLFDFGEIRPRPRLPHFVIALSRAHDHSLEAVTTVQG